ncbi:MAG: hypothetical protein CFE26_05000 [Verrucomicrobiales bacterium VVV1]|nr:MAG: hypothetical protein CFE26_05000 [Verrucomicrobiales bacterium VVV1]
MATGQEVKDNGWRQGSFLPSEMALSLALKHGCQDATHAIVVSQDCDVTYGDLEIEPFVEILFLHPLPSLNHGKTDGKSSRVLHLDAFEGTEQKCLSVQPWNQTRIRRDALAITQPDTSLAIKPGTLRGLIRWVADRYTRTGIPDEFVKRIDKIDDGLKKLMKREGQAFWRILVALDPPDEIDADKNYNLECVCAVWPEVWDDEEKQAKAIKAGEDLGKLIRSCDGISLDREVEVDSTDGIPLSHLHYYRSWDVFNFLSHRDLLKEG